MSITTTDRPACDLSAHVCNCAGNGASAIEEKAGYPGRFFITMGHCGFNSPANNRSGYASEGIARASVARYQGRGPRQR